MSARSSAVIASHFGHSSGRGESVDPGHYKTEGVEAIDAIRAALGHEGFIAYCRGQVMRYLWRLGKKDDALVEIGKAQVYAQWIKDTLDGKALTKGGK